MRDIGGDSIGTCRRPDAGRCATNRLCGRDGGVGGDCICGVCRWHAAPHELDARCVQFWPQIYAQNVWPADCGDFAERYLEMGQQVHAVGLTLLELCEVALGLDASG